MCAQRLKTDNIYLDFVINHVLAIIYTGNTGLSLIKYPSDYKEKIKKLPIDPPVTLYGRGTLAMHTNKKDQQPCLKTSGMNIKLLSKLSHLLDKSGNNNTVNAFSQEIKTIALLETEYFMDLILNRDDLSPRDIIWATDVFYTFCTYNNDLVYTWDAYYHFADVLGKHLEKALSEYITETYKTTELASALRSLSIKNSYLGFSGEDERIAWLVLETLSRRSKGIGLFVSSPDSNRVLPPTSQNIVLTTLIASLEYINIHHIVQDIKSILDKLYSLFLKDIVKCFAFSHYSTKYTSYNLGSIIDLSAELLNNNVLNWDRTDELSISLLELLKSIVSSYWENFEKEINSLHNYYNLIRHINKKGKKAVYKKPLPVFPNRVRLTYPGPVIEWQRKGSVRYFESLYLCYNLLSFARSDTNDSQVTKEKETSDSSVADALSLLKFIFELGS